MLVLLEGNIAAGKTTFGQRLAASGQFLFVPEPVERWQSGFAANLLERFYADTPRWAFTLQICAFLTRSQALENLPAHEGMIFERSVYCDRHVFAKNLHQVGLMDATEWALYLHFWERLAEMAPTPDAILYLRTPAEECFRRLQVRGRAEEKGITLAYLQQLEDRHDEWLLSEAAEAPVIVLDGTQVWSADEVRQQLEQVIPTP
ncbi:MAG: deoxynucleoside kinase [Chloroflexi bacterium]|jgi:deoxyadenosine/deoxycytidine kinase|nr:deoxynucleoside kinase [Chloroflexota bacterium]